MNILNKFIRIFKCHLSLFSNGRENSSLEMKGGNLVNILRPKRFAETLKFLEESTKELIRIRKFFTECKDKFDISRSTKRFQANTMGGGKPNTIQFVLSGSRCIIFSEVEERISGKLVNAGKQFGFLMIMFTKIANLVTGYPPFFVKKMRKQVGFDSYSIYSLNIAPPLISRKLNILGSGKITGELFIHSCVIILTVISIISGVTFVQIGKVHAADTISWNNSFNGNFEVRRFGEYPTVFGTFTTRQVSHSDSTYTRDHKFEWSKNESTRAAYGINNTGTKYFNEAWPWNGSNQIRLGDSSSYAIIYLVNSYYSCSGRRCIYFRMVPNSKKIITELLTTGGTIELIFTIIGNGVPTELKATFRKTDDLVVGLEADWSGSIANDYGALNSDGNPVVLSDPDVTGYSDLLATLRVGKKTGDYFSAGSEEYLNGGGRIVGSNSEQYAEDRLPPSFHRPKTRTYGRGWSNGSGRFRGGVWFFDELRHLVAFQPMKDRLDGLNAGDVVESHLTLHLIRGGGSSKRTLASVTLTAVIRVSGVTLTISGVSRTVVDNGAEFTITANNQPPDDMTVNVVPTNTSGSFLDTSFGASGSTVGISDLSFSTVAGSSTYSAKLNVPLVSDPGATEGMLTVALAADTSTPRNYSPGSAVSHTVTIVNECSSAAGSVCVSIEGNPVYTADRAMSGFKVTASHPPGQDLEVAVTGTTNSGGTACNVTIMAGATTATKVCAIDAASPDIKFTIQESQNYIIGKPAAAYSHFVDAAKPGMQLTVDKNTVVAGESFRLSATFTPQGQYSSIYFETEGVDWIDGTVPASFSSTSANGTAEITFSTKLRPGSGLNGEIVFTASPNPNWLLDENLKYATVNVRNLSLSVASTHATLTAMEGDTVMIKLIASNDPGEPIPVMFTPTNTSGAFLDVSSDPKYLASGTVRTESLTFALDSDGRYSAMLPVKLRDNNFQTEGNGTVTLSLNGFEDSANYAVGATDSSSTITVNDITAPAISISSSSNSVTEAEGATLTYEFTLPRPVDWDVSIAYAVSSDSTSESGDYGLGSDSPLIISGGSGDTSVSLSIIITNDEIYESHETLVLDLTATNAEFSGGGNTHVLTITITDDEEKPKISFKTATHSVAEGNQIELTLESTVLSETAFSIGFTPTDTAGDFLDVSTEASGMSRSTADLTFAPGESGSGPEGKFSIATRSANGTEDDNGEISVVLDTPAVSAPYTVDVTKNTVTVAVIDEFSVPTISVNQSSVTVAEAEGADLTFDFSLSGQTSGNEKITHSVSKDSTAKPEDYMLSPIEFNGTTSTLTVEIENDDIYEGDETLVLDLTANNAKFSDGGTTHTLTVTITDNEAKPEVSFKTAAYTVAEGDSVDLTLVASVASEDTYSIGYTMRNETGDFLSIPTGVSEKTGRVDSNFQPVGQLQELSFSIATREANGEKDADGVISVVLDTPEGAVPYTVADAAKTASVSVVDDSTYVISVKASRPSVTEGEDIEIVLECSPPPNSDLEVGLRVTQTGDSLVWPVKRQVRFTNGNGTVRLKLSTLSNANPNSNGRVTVALADSDDYRSGNPVTVHVTKPDPVATAPAKYSVVSSVITAILSEIPPTPPQGESSVVKPTLAIRAVTGTVTEGEAAVFAVSASHAVNSGIPVKIKLSQSGDFIVGPMDRSVNLKTDHSEAEFAVRTDNDSLAEADGTITATIQADREYLVATQNSADVIVSDALDRQHRKSGVSTALRTVLPDLLAHSTARTFDVASNRITQGFSSSPSTSIELNGKSPAMTALQSGGEMLNGSNTNWQSLIDDSSFTVALYPEGGETSSATIWGVGDKWRISSDGNGKQQSWDGETHTGHFGFDAQVGHQMLAGLAMSVSQSEIGYGQTGDLEMSFDSMATAAYPYFGFSSTDEKSQMMAMTGYGENTLELKQEAYLPEILRVHYNLVAIGGSSSVYSIGRFGDLHNLELSVAGEAWHARQYVDSLAGVTDNLQVESRHIRIAIEESHDHQLGGGGTITPSLSIGLRGDGRNDESVFSLNLDNRIKYAGSNGLEVSGSAKSMLSGLNRVKRWEIAGTVDYDSGNDNRGILFSMSQSWSGNATERVRNIWGSELTDISNVSTDSRDENILNAEIGFGFGILNDSIVLTPFHAIKQSSTKGSEFRFGSRFATESVGHFELEAVRNNSGTEVVGHELKLTGSISW